MSARGLGLSLVLVSASPAAAQELLFGAWAPVPDAAPAAELPLRASARERAALEPAADSEPPGMPAMLETTQAIEFEADADRVVMRFAEWDTARTIYMNPRNGPPIQEHSPHGVSFGRWEGETLAIFTTYISYPYFDRRGTPQSRDVTVLERYTPSADSARLEWRVTVTDPATFTGPVTRRGAMVPVLPSD